MNQTSSNPGPAFGKYHVIAELGRGGMAKVYLAVVRGPAGFNKLLVLKVLRANLSLDADFLAMFLDEARLSARLNHANIVQTNEVGQTGDSYFIAMEYLDGQPLVNVLKRALARGGLPVPMVLRIVADVCAGLGYAHTLKNFDGTPLGVVHRDISPQNIFVTYGGQVKIVDFGIAKATSRSVETQTGVLKGKVAYMPPEQAQGIEVDHRADVFAAGVVLLESLTSTRMWAKNDVDIIRALLDGEVPSSAKARRPDLSDDVDAIVARALAVDRDARYASAPEMQRDLERAIAAQPSRASHHEIGELMAKLFEKERAQIDATIHKQLQHLESSGDAAVTASLPNLTIGGGLAMTPSDQATRAERSAGASARARSRKRSRVFAMLGGAIILGGVATWVAVTRTGPTSTSTSGLGSTSASTSPSISAAIAPSASATASASAPASATASASASSTPSAASASASAVPRWRPPIIVPTATANPLGDRK